MVLHRGKSDVKLQLLYCLLFILQLEIQLSRGRELGPINRKPAKIVDHQQMTQMESHRVSHYTCIW